MICSSLKNGSLELRFSAIARQLNHSKPEHSSLNYQKGSDATTIAIIESEIGFLKIIGFQRY
jgi:hypothetical protein